MVSRPCVCRLPSASDTSVDQWDSLAATGICEIGLLYAANRALKTSVVSSLRVQPRWFDTRHKLVSELETEVLQAQT